MGTVGTAGTAPAKVTVGYCGSTRGYCRVLWVLWVLQGSGYCGYCRVFRKLELRVLYATLTGIETSFEISSHLIFRGDEITVYHRCNWYRKGLGLGLG